MQGFALADLVAPTTLLLEVEQVFRGDIQQAREDSDGRELRVFLAENEKVDRGPREMVAGLPNPEVVERGIAPALDRLREVLSESALILRLCLLFR